jgi:primosomal protein N' (replication factor Y)
MRTRTASPTGIREITEACDALPPLPLAWRELVAFAAGYYQRGLGEIALSVLPVELRRLDNAAIANRLARLDKRLAREAAADAAEAEPPLPELSPAQAEAGERIAEAMTASEPATVLLHGATGSGKTEVYLRASARAPRARPPALVLVPEINLTPQLVARFAARFPGRRIVALHSGLTPAARLRHWLMRAHRPRRHRPRHRGSAVFTPLPAARPRRRRRGARPVVQAAGRARATRRATSPSGAAGARTSRRCSARRRPRSRAGTTPRAAATCAWPAGADRRRGVARGAAARHGALPKQRGAPVALAPALVAAIEARVARGEQSLVFLNRRGYAPVLLLRRMQLEERLPHCSAWRVFHKQDRTPALPSLRPRRRGAARLPRLRQPRHRADRPRHRAARGADGALLPGRGSPASTPTARAGRARSRRSSARCTRRGRRARRHADDRQGS